jgi:hypothetical protein
MFGLIRLLKNMEVAAYGTGKKEKPIALDLRSMNMISAQEVR